MDEAYREFLIQYYSGLSKEEKERELKRLATLYCERRDSFEKAEQKRWILTFVGFATSFLVISLVISFVLSRPTLEDVLNADITAIGAFLLGVLLFTGFYFFVNISIFGWLFEKSVKEGRAVDNIMREIRLLEKNLQN